MIDACHACAGRGEGGCVRAVNCRHRSRDRIRTQRQSALRIEWPNAFYGPHRGHLHGQSLGVVVERARPLRRYGLRLVKRMNESINRITQLHQLMYLLTATCDRPEPRATTEEAQSFALSSVCISSSCSGISSACGLAEHADLIDALSSRARSARPPAHPTPAPSAGSASARQEETVTS